jgi:hypothetical protein
MGQDPRDAVARAARKTSEVKSYAARFAMTIEGGADNALDLVMEGGYSPESGLFLSGKYLTRALGLYRKDGKNAVLDENGRWVKSEEIRPAPGRAPPGRNIPTPHEEIRGLESKLKEVKKSEGEKRGGVPCDVYVAELTDEGARAYLPPAARIGGVKAVGDVKLWIDPAAELVVEYLLVLIVEGGSADRAFRVTTQRSFLLSRFNEAKIDVPAAARQALEK